VARRRFYVKRGALYGNKGAAPAVPFLFRDEFITDDAAPMTSPHTCEPGPGSATILDTTNKLSISGGVLSCLDGVERDNKYKSATTFDRSAGLALYADVVGAWPLAQLGWRVVDDDSWYFTLGMWTWYGSLNASHGSGWSNFSIGGDGKVGRWFVILRDGAGAYYVRKTSDVYYLMYVSKINTAASGLTIIAGVSGGVSSFDNVSVKQAASPWTSDSGLQSFYDASASAGDTGTQQADGIVEATWVAVTGETYELSFRMTDVDNRWIIRIDQAGSTLKIIERNAGAETERSTAAVTFTNGTSYRVQAYLNDEFIFITTAVFLEGQYWTAAFNKTATMMKTSHAVTDFTAWDRTLSEAAIAALDAL